MADNFNDMLIDLFGAMDRVTAAHINKLEFDKTITAEIIDNSNKNRGEYIVSDGSTSFKAYSENENYSPGTWVYVQIPNGDFNNQKIITGKYINNNTEYYTYVAPLDSYVDITKNLIETGISSTGLVANGTEKYITIWENLDFKDGKCYDRLGIKADFRTWLSSVKTTQGTYGLRLDIIGEETNTTQTEPSYKPYSFKLDSSDFYGDVYNFETFYSQEAVFDITGISKIVSMRLVFYQDGNFKNNKGQDIAGFLDDGVELDPNIFVQNPYISLGLDLQQFDEDQVMLYTLDSETYASYLTGEVKDKYLIAAEAGNAEAIAAIKTSSEAQLKAISERREVVENTYKDKVSEIKSMYPAASTEYTDAMEAANEWKQTENEKLDKEKAEVDKQYNTFINAYYNDSGLNKPGVFTDVLNEINAKTLQVRWIHRDENGQIRAIDSKEKMPDGSKIHWYRYVLEEGIADDLAGPFWQEVFPNDNVFVYENFVPNTGKSFEQFKIIVECLSQEYVEEQLIFNDQRIIELDRLIELEQATEEEEQERENLYSSYLEQINFYESEPLTLNNETAVPDQATIDLIKGLEIVCDEAGYKGVYNIYTENGDIMAQSEVATKRILSARYSTLITGQNIFDTAEKITWRIPIHNTMIYTPTEGVEYTYYDIAFVTSGEELIPGYHYTRDLDGVYHVVEDKNYSAENMYFVKNNTEVRVNEEGGYVDIIRYGVVSSREPGSEEADTTEQYFRIKPFYTQAATNNTVYCIINKNNREYVAEFSMSFGPTGTNGTNYTFVLEFDNAAPAMTWSDVASERKGVTIRPKVFNYEREDITDQFSNFTYSWYCMGKGGLKPIQKVGKNAVLSFANTVTEISGTRPTQIEDCNYYILKGSVKANIEVVEQKVDSELKSTTTPNEMEFEESAQPAKTREVTLTAFLPIPIRGSDKWVSFNGVDKICYDLTGTNPNYYKDSCSLYYYNSERKRTEKDNEIYWEMSLGIDTGYADGISDLNKIKIFKYYPTINPIGFLTPTSLYLQENGKQVSIIARSYNPSTGREKIEWIQPIRIYQDSYSSSVLNSWDGSLTIDEENGKILSAMIGAGKKDSENRFNGILMGDVSIAGETEGAIPQSGSANEIIVDKELSEYYSGTGLYGYNAGVKSFGLNINGKAFFGKPGNGQILINGNDGSIQSRRYIQTKNNNDNDQDKSGMIIDLDKGSIKSYGEATKAAVIIDPTRPSETKPIFETKSSAGNSLLFIGDRNYYLQSDNYQEENDSQGKIGSGINFNLYRGKIDAYNFELKAKNSSDGKNRGSYIRLSSSGDPFLRVHHQEYNDDGNVKHNLDILDITNTNFDLRSHDWVSGSSGTQIRLGANGSGITSYNFNLEATSTRTGAKPTDKIIINSKAGTHPLSIGGNDNFSVTWGGVMTSKGASIVKAGISEATITDATIKRGTISNAKISNLDLKYDGKWHQVNANRIHYVSDITSVSLNWTDWINVVGTIFGASTATVGKQDNVEALTGFKFSEKELTMIKGVTINYKKGYFTALGFKNADEDNYSGKGSKDVVLQGMTSKTIP